MWGVECTKRNTVNLLSLLGKRSCKATLLSRATCSWEIFLKIHLSYLGNPGHITTQCIAIPIQSPRETWPSSKFGHVANIWVNKLPDDFWPQSSCHLKSSQLWPQKLWNRDKLPPKFLSYRVCENATKFCTFCYTALANELNPNFVLSTLHPQSPVNTVSCFCVSSQSLSLPRSL